jgi:hypothetical protein
MRFSRFAPERAVPDPFFVPPGRVALAIRDGRPDRFHPPGFLVLPQGKVEVRLLERGPARFQDPPDAGALTLPYERSWLHLDGTLVGIVRPGGAGTAPAASAIEAWEGFAPSTPRPEAPEACLSEPMRICLPRSGVCCGGRMLSWAGSDAR